MDLSLANVRQAMTQKTPDQDPEILAISQVYSALRSLNTDAQQRVLDYVSRKLELTIAGNVERRSAENEEEPLSPVSRPRERDDEAESAVPDDALEGLSPAARKWMKRNGLTSEQLSQLFSLGIDEIDLVAKKVPGKSVRDKMRSVLLLKGVAAYLGTGVPRVTYDQIKEAAQHYGAFDNTNFSKYLKSMAADVSGTRETGFSLTARGLTEATSTVRELVAAES
jgi:hypothetical protein